MKTEKMGIIPSHHGLNNWAKYSVVVLMCIGILIWGWRYPQEPQTSIPFWIMLGCAVAMLITTMYLGNRVVKLERELKHQQSLLNQPDAHLATPSSSPIDIKAINSQSKGDGIH